jgi:hypothetical protein
MSRRQRAYIAFRGSAAFLFLMSALVLPRGAIAASVCVTAGLAGLLSCIGANAGGPGERAGAATEKVVYDRSRAPQGDWPPFPEDRVIEGELQN